MQEKRGYYFFHYDVGNECKIAKYRGRIKGVPHDLTFLLRLLASFSGEFRLFLQSETLIRYGDGGQILYFHSSK